MAVGAGSDPPPPLAVTVKLADVALVRPEDVNVMVWGPLPVTARLLKVATPLVALTVVVPDSVPLPDANAAVTDAPLDVTVLPLESWIRMDGCGLSADPDEAPPGCVCIPS